MYLYIYKYELDLKHKVILIIHNLMVFLATVVPKVENIYRLPMKFHFS